MKTITRFFNAGLVIIAIWTIVALVLLTVKIVAGNEYYEIMYYDMRIGYLDILLPIVFKFCFMMSGILYMWGVTKAYTAEQKRQKFEFENQNK